MVKRVFNILTYILLLFLILIVLFNIFSVFYFKINGSKKYISMFGYMFFIEASESMEPEIRKGDLIIAKNVDYLDLDVGDIIVFDEINNDISVTHRIISKNSDGSLITKGDANNKDDIEVVNSDNYVAKYIFKLFSLGTVLLFFSTGTGFLVLLLIVATLLVVSYLISLVLKKEN